MRDWLHPQDALLSGHILYTVKFLGECSVEQPKGLDVVKDAIRKMKFNKHIRRAEGHKPPKVDLLISSEAVKVVDPKTMIVLHEYPLHRISYCADDKSDKRVFTFIGKAVSNNQHFCYVFDSEKCAEEITLTIGQAFDLAYKKFLESSPGDSIRKQVVNLNKQVQTLKTENEALKARIAQLEKLKDRADIEEYKKNNQIEDLSTGTLTFGESSTDDVPDTSAPAQQASQKTVVGRRLEHLIFTDEVDSSASQEKKENDPFSVLTPPPTSTRQHRPPGTGSAGVPVKGNPFKPSPATSNQFDPFGMPAFNPTGAAQAQQPKAQPQSSTEQELIDIQAGFSRGLAFGTDDFSLDDLDPLNQK